MILAAWAIEANKEKVAEANKEKVAEANKEKVAEANKKKVAEAILQNNKEAEAKQKQLNLEAFRPWTNFRVRAALLGRASQSSVLARLSQNLLQYVLFSPMPPHELSIFEEVLYEEALNSVNPMPIQRVFQLLQANFKLCAAYQRTTRRRSDVQAMQQALMNVERYLDQNEDEVRWLYTVADKNEAEAENPELSPSADNEDPELSPLLNFCLPEFAALLLPLLVAYGPGEGSSVQQRVDWLLLLDVLFTKPLRVMNKMRLHDQRRMETYLTEIDTRQFCSRFFDMAQWLALGGHQPPSSLLMPLFTMPNPNHPMGNKVIHWERQWGHLLLPVDGTSQTGGSVAPTEQQLQLLSDRPNWVGSDRSWKPFWEITQETVGESIELQAVFGTSSDKRRQNYPGGKDLSVDARTGLRREPYATHKFVRLNLEDRQKIMDEFQITAEDWPLLIRVYYRTQLFLPVEVHAEDLDTVTYLATFIGVSLFRVTACSTASIRSELAAVRKTAFRALQFAADVRGSGNNFEKRVKSIDIACTCEV